MSEEKEKDLVVELLRDRAALNEALVELEQDDYEIDFAGFFHVLKKRILIIILAAIVGASLMGAYSHFIVTPMYESTAKVYVLTQSKSIKSMVDIEISSELALDYTEMIFSYPVVRQVISNLNLDYSYNEVAGGMLEVENPADTRVIKIRITSDDPEEAAAMVNEFAVVSKQTISDIMETDEPKIFEHGRVTTDPVSPNTKKNMLIGFCGGAFIVILILFILFVARDIIRTPEDIQRRLGGNVLAVVPLERGGKKRGKR